MNTVMSRLVIGGYIIFLVMVALLERVIGAPIIFTIALFLAVEQLPPQWEIAMLVVATICVATFYSISYTFVFLVMVGLWLIWSWPRFWVTPLLKGVVVALSLVVFLLVQGQFRFTSTTFFYTVLQLVISSWLLGGWRVRFTPHWLRTAG